MRTSVYTCVYITGDVVFISRAASVRHEGSVADICWDSSEPNLSLKCSFSESCLRDAFPRASLSLITF